MNNPLDPGPCFNLKSHALSMIFVELNYYDEMDFEELLGKKIGQAPGFLRDAPLVIDLERYTGLSDELNFFTMIGQCRKYNMNAFAVKSANKKHIAAAKTAGLAIIKPVPKNPKDPETPEEAEAAPAEPVDQQTVTEVEARQPRDVQTAPTKIVRQSIRSGQTIEAPEGDLIVIGPVQAGAEVKAAGNIHIYGPLRGKAMAGLHGDESASVFCQSLEAELISVAGQYKLSEDLQGDSWKSPTYLYFSDGQLMVQELAQ